MGAVVARMEERLFPALAARRTEMPVVPEGARHSTLNINSIHGGESEQAADYTGLPSPCVPDRCRMVIDRRFLIEEDIGAVESEIRDLLDSLRSGRAGFDYTLRELHRVLPTMTDRDAPVVGAVARAVDHVFGHTADYVVSPGTYDQKHIDRIGRLKNCIAYGPGILDLAHKPDEYVGIDDMEQSALVMALALADLLGD
jgi:succinyl-diaminopimelate desuccinylase